MAELVVDMRTRNPVAELLAAAARDDIKNNVHIIPLRTWIRDETERLASEQQQELQQQQLQQEQQQAKGTTTAMMGPDPATITVLKNQSLIRQISVAFGAAELMRHASRLTRHYNHHDKHTTTSTTTITTPASASDSDSSFSILPLGAQQCSMVDNFNVHVSKRRRRRRRAGASSSSQSYWNNVKGVSMLNPELSAQLLEEPFFLLDDDNDDNDAKDYSTTTTTTAAAAPTTTTTTVGRYVEIDIYPPLPRDCTMATNNADSNDDHDEEEAESASSLDQRNECRSFGMLLYEICTGICPLQLLLQSDEATITSQDYSDEPQKKRSTAVRKGNSDSTTFDANAFYAPLQEIGFPSSVSTLVQSLIDGHDAYLSLDAVCSDIQLLLSDPECYLFDDIDRFVAQQGGSSMQPQVKIGKLYGREDEVTLVTDAFCRVSSGKNEALFIGGYSGSGKSMLVQSLNARIDIAGGYVLTHKCDETSKERPLLDVLHAFDELCLLILKKSCPQTLLEISNKLVNVFESDFSVLARLLPNINIVFPELAKKPTTADETDGSSASRNLQGMSLNNVCCTLQRFMRIVSCADTPVMLFLDDLQWAGSTSLELIDALLSDKRGSTCFLFVGSYRDNEVHVGHPIFQLMSSLDSSGVRSTKLQLSGLNRNCLNVMISESLGILPYLCKPLGDIIFEKTEGNPYFALEFLRSLVDRRLLNYSVRERRWIWDESKIRSENITDNVLHLLAAKMTSLPQDIQTTLQILSCFGIKVDQTIVDNLCLSKRFVHFSHRLMKAVDESFIQTMDNGFIFIHDKVREAAYSLIPDGTKSQVSSSQLSLSIANGLFP